MSCMDQAAGKTLAMDSSKERELQGLGRHHKQFTQLQRLAGT